MSPTPGIINKTLEFSDMNEPPVRATTASLRRWLWRWLLTGGRFAVNGHVKRRIYIRRHKMWEYSRGLALTGAAAPVRDLNGARFNVLDIGGAMTSTIFYLAGLGDRVLCLDIDEAMCDQTNRVARARGLPLEARTDNLATDDPDPAALGADDGFDRVYCFCVIEHVLPPGQLRLARALGSLVRPGGQLCLTFDYGEQAPTEAPIRRPQDVEEIREAIGLPLTGNGSFVDTGRRYALNKHYPLKRYTFGSLFFHRPVAQP